jgi:hypothetical protein
MQIINKTSLFFIFAMALATFQFGNTEASAQSTYYTSQGCSGCHTTVSTCNGCHAHGTHASSTKTGINEVGTTNKTSYAPGETVSVTITGGYRNGWVRAVLYDQNQVELARSTGNDSGLGSSTTLPATLSAPAPTAPGTYSWKVAWYGNKYDASGATFGTGWLADPTNPDHGQEIVSTNSFTVAAPADTTPPVTTVSPAGGTYTSAQNVTLTANEPATIYYTTNGATPTIASPVYSGAIPIPATITLKFFARDTAGNSGTPQTATYTIADTTAPVVSAFALPATATSLTVPVTTFTATDNVGVTGYLITTSATSPAASATGWTATAPASVTAVAGSNTFYAWVKDAAGNVSLSRSASVTVTLPDTTIPVVSAFALPATATNLTVAVTTFAATDNVGVTGYLISTSATAPAASATGWTATAPASVTAVAGSNTFYAWVKDAAGNVSLSRSASVTVTLPDTTIPVVSAFALPATATNLTVLITTFTATDNVGVTGYLISTSATAPTSGWLASAPASVTAVAGSNTFYAWVKDAAGNVSLSKNASVTVTIPPAADTTVPVVSAFTLPATATALTVPVSSFTATDNVGVTGYQITTSATAPTSGWLASAPASVTAVAGSNTFYAWVMDAAGNVSLSRSASVTVTIQSADTTKPTLTISALDNGTYTNKVTLNITGSSSDASGIKSVTVNDQPVTVNPDGTFSTALTLTVGANTITVMATDNAGNQQSDTRTVTFDPNSPVLAVTEPADNSQSSQSFITISGTVNETTTVSVIVNNGNPQAASISGNSFSATVNLAQGVNTIVINATDLAGNVSTAKRTVTYGTTSMALAITSPAQDITTRNPAIFLKGTVIDPLGNVTVSITMDGKTYTPHVADGAFKQRLNFTTPKLYTITVTATDAAGNSSTVYRNVIYSLARKGDNRHDD